MYLKTVKEINLKAFQLQKNALALVKYQLPNFYNKPQVHTQFPTEAHLAAMQAPNQAFDQDLPYYQRLSEHLDCKWSMGNYLVDVEGNCILDLNASSSGNVLGYQHDAFQRDLMDSELYDRFVTKKQKLEDLSPSELADLIREQAMPSAPEGLIHVHVGSGSSGTEANELAINAALNHYAKEHGKSIENLVVLGFNNSNHGSSTVTLSCSSADVNTEEVPTLNWPRAPFPQLKYPFAEHEHENQAEEKRCIDAVKDMLKAQSASGKEVAAIIVEPISSISNQMATPVFFKTLRSIAKSEGIAFIVDETKTGLGQTGKYWGHQHWFMSGDQVPDYVTFGGKSGISGFYASQSHKLNDEATSVQGELNLHSLIRYGQIFKITQNLNLLHLLGDTSLYLRLELERIEKELRLISNIRGYGTHLAFDLRTPEKCDSVQRWLWHTGVNTHKCGPKQLALRPSLTLSIEDASQLRKNLQYYTPHFQK
uniref:Uncharacterized protein n=1 Tax=Strombidium rassoulzadegani TaxID=1082188 RepID=A0A7S3FX22_9SPIT|mmetsp:Transcript_9781/g.16466  ORF Transcript_9781/g.16466 Transcript_9781/m.16466 type:complete len:481 (+) Transcript_9781:13-1455(+)